MGGFLIERWDGRSALIWCLVFLVVGVGSLLTNAAELAQMRFLFYPLIPLLVFIRGFHPERGVLMNFLIVNSYGALMIWTEFFKL